MHLTPATSTASPRPAAARPGAPVRSAWSAVLVVLVAAFVGGVPAAAQGEEGSGEAVPGYQFWGYYQLQDEQWAFATEGANATDPEDGTVEGWRFAVTAEGDTRFPRASASFEELCADQPEAVEGDKRVGVVVDPGRDVDAPEGEQPGEPSGHCAVVPADASGLEVLQAAVGEVRTDADGGMVCGMQGFPESGCGDPVGEVTEEEQAADEPVELAVTAAGDQNAGAGAATEAPEGDEAGTPEQTEEQQESDEGTPWWAWALVVLAALVLLALVRRTRSRSSAAD